MFPKRGALTLATTVLALILLFQFKTPDESGAGGLAGADSTAPGAVASPVPTDTNSTPPAGSPATAAPSSASDPGTGSGSSSATATTLVGPVVSTRYGNVEVQVTIKGGAITKVDAVALPTGGRSGQISRIVAPMLAGEVLAAQSARINVVSGATYTSQAYARSLQAALDQATIVVNPVTG